MIREPAALARVRREWDGVEALRKQFQASAAESLSMPAAGGSRPFSLALAAHNLPFLHAFSVLTEVLSQLSKEGRFSCDSIVLGSLMNASLTALPWQDLNLIDEGRQKRNEVAHQGRLLETADCWKYVNAVKPELSAWGIV